MKAPDEVKQLVEVFDRDMMKQPDEIQSGCIYFI